MRVSQALRRGPDMRLGGVRKGRETLREVRADLWDGFPDFSHKIRG